MKKFSFYLALAGVAAFAVSCSKVSEKDIVKILEEKPELITKAIEKNPEPVLEALTKASQKVQEKRQQEAQVNEEKSRNEEFKNPKKPKLDASFNYRGPDNAKITIVEYSDFQCPFCSRGYETMNQVMKKYPDLVRMTYKHLPLSFHPQAMISAQYFEAVALQDKKKAWEFHDNIFQNQDKLKDGEKFLKEIAAKLKLDIKKLESDVKSEKVKKKIEEDMAEAGQFGFQGTPGFLINGVSLKGAYPVAEFESIIEKIKKM